MDFSEFIAVVHKQFGLNLSAYKEKQLKRRIDNLCCSVGVDNYKEYFALLCTDPVQRAKFFDKITINVSEFFRNSDIFQALEKIILPELCSSRRKLKIWSAACSNGAEPYSIAIILNDSFPGISYKIDATDIDSNILAAARVGVYDEKAVKGVSKARLQKYFVRDNTGFYRVTPEVKRHVVFSRHDLLGDKFEKGYDLIVCRNVMIYFTRQTQEILYRKMYDSLVNGGVLFIGATENIIQYKDYGFEKVSHWFYRKSCPQQEVRHLEVR
jgi:chemotaxis protein methyltransferase CheR